MINWTPRQYQKTALAYMLSNRFGGLFLDPGLGKTSISLHTICKLLAAEDITGALVIAPLRVIYTVWPAEVAKWAGVAHLKIAILHGNQKQAQLKSQADIYVINPEGVPWLHSQLLAMSKSGAKLPFDKLIVDESTKFKSPTVKRFKLLKTLLPIFTRRYILTGTPSPNNLLDLWAQLYIVDRGQTLGTSYYQFREKYFYQASWSGYNWLPLPGAAAAIYKLVSNRVLDMSSAGHLDLPPILYNVINVQLPPAALADYKRMEKDYSVTLGSTDVTALAASQAMQKCHQMANGCVYTIDDSGNQIYKILHTAKLDALDDLLEELSGKPLLVAYHYKHDLHQLLSRWPGTPNIGSGVSPAETAEIIRKWNAGELPLLLAHPASMSHGLNLQDSNGAVCWYSLTWSLEQYIQFNARIHRQGVRESVTVHHLVAKNTVDEVMLTRISDKDKAQTDLRTALRDYFNTGVL